MEKKQEQNQENPQQQTQSRRGYQPIDESKINWQELEEKWGVKRDDIEKSGDLTKMLNYGKSDLVKVSPKFGGEAFELDARLSFKKDGEGNISLVPHFIRKEQKLDEYKEHKFSDEDRKNLRETGNLGRVCAGQEATVRTGHGTMIWFKIGKGVHQGSLLSPCLFNLYAEYIMQNPEVDESQNGINIAGRNINNLRYADDATVMEENKELKSLLMKVKEENEKAGLKLSIPKAKVTASGHIT